MKTYLHRNKSTAFLILSMLFLVTDTFAQTELTTTETHNFKKAVAQKVRENTSLSGQFIQTQQLGYMKSGVESSGVFFYEKPDKLKWEYKKPYSFSLLFKKGHLTITDQGKQKNIDVASNPLFEKLSGLIAQSINGKLLEDNDFKNTYYKENHVIRVKLIPQKKDLKEVFSEIDLFFDPQSHLVKKAKLSQPEGDFTIIYFKNVKLNANIPASVFVD